MANSLLLLADPLPGGPPTPARSLPDDVEVDYVGADVTPATLLRLLSGRLPASTPPDKRLGSTSGSNVLLYYAGHAGDSFLKFQVRATAVHVWLFVRPYSRAVWGMPVRCAAIGREQLVCRRTPARRPCTRVVQDIYELQAAELWGALGDMHAAGRFRKLLLVLDTCDAATMFDGPWASVPGVTAVGSSRAGENSYAHGVDVRVGGHACTIAPLPLHCLACHVMAQRQRAAHRLAAHAYRASLVPFAGVRNCDLCWAPSRAVSWACPWPTASPGSWFDSWMG